MNEQELKQNGFIFQSKGNLDKDSIRDLIKVVSNLKDKYKNNC